MTKTAEQWAEEAKRRSLKYRKQRNIKMVPIESAALERLAEYQTKHNLRSRSAAIMHLIDAVETTVID